MEDTVSETHNLFIYKSTLYQLKYDATKISRINFTLIKTAVSGDDSNKNISVLQDLPSHFNDSEIIIIDSVTSGVGRDKRDFYKDVLKTILDDLEISHQYIKTETKDTIKDFADSLDRTKNYTLLLLSGDTSVFEIANTIQRKREIEERENFKKGSIKISFFPMGSGNSLASAIRINTEVDAIMNLFFNDISAKLPVYKITFPEESFDIVHSKPVKNLFFLCCVSTAIHAQLIYEAEKPGLREMGLERFKYAAGKVLQQPSITYKGQALDINDISFSKKIINHDSFNYFIICAVPFLEKGYMISPDSKLGKNELHIVSFVNYDHATMASAMFLPYQNGLHIKEQNVEYLPLNKGLIYKLGDEPDERSNLCIDGTVVQIKNSKDKIVKIETIDTQCFEIDIIGANSYWCEDLIEN